MRHAGGSPRLALPRRRPAPLLALDVCKRFGGVAALAGVDLRVGARSVVGLVGPNGSGKTTLLHAVAGLVPLDSGLIVVAGAAAGSRPARAAAILVPDDPTGFDELTVAELVALVRAVWAADERAGERAQVLLDAFGLSARADQRLGTLSRGLRRQASAVAAFAVAPPLVLVDEATATLDPEAVVVLGEAVAALARSGSGVLLATQDLGFAESACDEVVILHRGTVIERGAPVDLRSRHGVDSLEDVFLTAVGDGRLRADVREAFRAL